MQFNKYILALLLITIGSLQATVVQMDEVYPEFQSQEIVDINIRPYLKTMIILTPLQVKALHSLTARQWLMIAILDTYFPSNLVKEIQRLVQEMKLESQKAEYLIHLSQHITGT